MIDYQIQTTASDGKYSPRECVEMAKARGLVSIAITDHDTVAGVAEALRAGREYGIEVLSGVEMSSAERGRGVHVLGIGVDHLKPSLVAKLEEIGRNREERARQAVEKLRAYGFSVDFDAVRRHAKGVIASPHIADAILENPANAAKLAREGIKGRKDMYPAYLGEQAKYPVFGAYPRLTAEEAIERIHGAGGIAIWSHPTIPLQDFKLVEEVLQRLKAAGLDGIEAVGNFTEDETEFLNMLAGKHDLLRTAGSDFHSTEPDPTVPLQGALNIGELKTYGYSLEGIRESVLTAIGKRAQVAAASGL